MERTGKDTNRHRTVFNQIRNSFTKSNLVTPEMLDHIWMDEDSQSHTGGVKIIELNSESSESPLQSPVTDRQAGHAWSHVNNERFVTEENDYVVNHEARSRRRMNMNQTNDNFTSTYTNQYYYDMQPNSNSFYETYDSGINNTHMNHQMNCFTIINPRVQSDSSTDNESCETFEIREKSNAEENKHWDHVYNEEVITYDPKKQCEKRTIWIYSYKNQRLLSENDYELVNTPNRSSRDATSTSTSSSISDEGLKADKTTACRMSSPIPATFIPRLDLSLVQTLSTVTEVSEPKKSHSKDSMQERVHLKPRNNWLSDKGNKENSNVVNWMALSPRERRRRSINTDSDALKSNFKETVVTYAEGDKHLDQVSIKFDKIQSSTVQVQVDIHANEEESNKEVLTSASSNKSKSIGVKKIADILPMKISFADADIDSDHENMNVELDHSNIPFIQISSKYTNTEITDPIEKLNCHNWISDEKSEKEATVYNLENAAEVHFSDSSSESVEVNSASRRLWMRNMQLMKSQQWAEYLPITCSPPSLHLSMSLSSVNCRKSWFRRLTKCLKCCK